VKRLIKRLHVWLGLANLTIFLIYGVTGLAVTMLPAPEERARPEARLELIDFSVPANLTDKQVADLVWERLRVPLASPVPEWALRRDGANNLAFAFYTPNGVTRVAVLEAENKLRVAHERAGAWSFLNNLHASTLRDRPVDWRLRAWVLYNELAMFSLLLMSASGLYLWLASRPRHRPAQVCFGVGTGALVFLYWLVR
jgi:hypothetical protein